MDPESKPQESSLAPLENVCTSSAQYPACISIKRTPHKNEIDPAIEQSFSVNFDLLPLVEAKIHDYKYMKHVSLETNEFLKCRWRAFRDCLGIREREPFQFPSADNFHFYNYQTRYIPCQIKNKDYRRRLTHEKKLDELKIGTRFVPNELHFKNNRIQIIKPKPEVKPRKGKKVIENRRKQLMENHDLNSAIQTKKQDNVNHSPRDNIIDSTQKDPKKLMQHRGLAPFLRKNSLKLISNSNVCIFRWSKSQYRCFCCKKPFSDIELLRNHTKTHELEDIDKSIIFQQNKHIKVEISNLSCEICTKKFSDLKELTEHLKNHGIHVKDHLLIPFKIENELKCQFCYKSFSKFSLLNVHMNKYYKTCICHLCGLSFSNSKYLTQHKLRKHKPISCKLCDLTFKTMAEKKLHENKAHGVEKKIIPRYPCQYCDERFNQENSRILHLVEKHGEKKPEFSCDLCCKMYISRSLLNAHIKTSHLKEKIHECEICTKSFYTNSDLSRHRTTHSGKKNFTCLNCNNLFASKDTLRRHMKRTHYVY